MRIACSTILLAAVLLLSVNIHADQHKQVVGATEVIQIEDVNLMFKARVDTGAKSSSIHAENIQVDLSGDPRGKAISFYLVNKAGQSRRLETRVASVVKVKTAEGSEYRYKVPLTLKWNNSSKTVLVTLNDRATMQYGLLIGRDWLHGDFIVDVEKNNED